MGRATVDRILQLNESLTPYEAGQAAAQILGEEQDGESDDGAA